MLIADLCNRDVVIASGTMSLPDAAKLMRAYHVGAVIVVEERDRARYPVGILTDRDLVVGVVADHPECVSTLSVEDVMTRDLVTVEEHLDITVVLKTMRAHGIRRIPVVKATGELVGIASFDDIIELLADQMTDLAHLLAREQRHEKEVRDLGTEGSRETRH